MKKEKIKFNIESFILDDILKRVKTRLKKKKEMKKFKEGKKQNG